MSFGIYILATPIGNLDDISNRGIETLKSCDFIVCENPKHSIKLLNKLGIKKKLISLHDYNEISVIKRLTNELPKKKIVLISDAGSPLISDPGFKLIKYCINNKINLTTIPGPSSIIPALQLSGIPINEFYFAGFVPKSKKEIVEFIKKITDIGRTSVSFVSNHKLKLFLEILETKLKDRAVSVSKELTKINEKTYRGNINEIIDQMAKQKDALKGEFVIVVEGNSQKKTKSTNLNNYNDEIRKLLSKFSLTDVVEIVHKMTRINKNKVYKWVLELKKS